MNGIDLSRAWNNTSDRRFPARRQSDRDLLDEWDPDEQFLETDWTGIRLDGRIVGTRCG